VEYTFHGFFLQNSLENQFYFAYSILGSLADSSTSLEKQVPKAGAGCIYNRLKAGAVYGPVLITRDFFKAKGIRLLPYIRPFN
jgi:hypothetical protein